VERFGDIYVERFGDIDIEPTGATVRPEGSVTAAPTTTTLRVSPVAVRMRWRLLNGADDCLSSAFT
jgi:hypothetical protein